MGDQEIRPARRLREERGWSREKLAAEAGLSFQTVYRLERGRYPRVEHLISIADALAVSLDELTGRNPHLREKAEAHL